MKRPRICLIFSAFVVWLVTAAFIVDATVDSNNYIDDSGHYNAAAAPGLAADTNNDAGVDFLRGPSMKVRKEIFSNGGYVSEDGDKPDDLVQKCLTAVNNCTNTQDTLLIHVALFLLSDRKWRPEPGSSQIQYVLSGCEKYERFIQCVEGHTIMTQYNSQECFDLSGFSDSFGFRWHRCNRFKRWIQKKPSRRHSRSRYYFRRHGRMRI